MRIANRRGRRIARTARPAPRFDDVEVGARVGHQRRELLQRADLVRHDPAHRLGGLARLLRQFQHAAPQLLPRRVELALDLARHRLDVRDRVAEPFGRLIERAGELGVGLVDGRLEALRGLLAFLGRRVADRFRTVRPRRPTRRGRRGERRADLLGARLRPAEARLDVGGELLQHRIEADAALRELADQPLEAHLPMFEGGVDRLLLRGELLRRLRKLLRRARRARGRARWRRPASSC